MSKQKLGLSDLIPDRARRAGQVFEAVLTVDMAAAWAEFGLVAQSLLTADERERLARIALAAVPPREALAIARDTLAAADWPLPPFLGGMAEARLWAASASREERKALALAAIEEMRPADRAALLRHLGERELAA